MEYRPWGGGQGNWKLINYLSHVEEGKKVKETQGKQNLKRNQWKKIYIQ